MSVKQVHYLRRSGRLKEAFSLAVELYRDDANEYTTSALFWAIRDLIKLFLGQKNQAMVDKHMVALEQLYKRMDDDRGFARNALVSLRAQSNPYFSKQKKYEELSKQGEHREALRGFAELYEKYGASLSLHEPYGWAIYRYIRSAMTQLTVDEVVHYFDLYLELKNPRPSLLHTQMLYQASATAKQFENFSFTQFWEKWDPSFNLLRREDLQSTYDKGKTYPPIIEVILRNICSLSPQEVAGSVKRLSSYSTVSLTPYLEVLSSQYYWQIYKKKGEKKTIYRAYQEVLGGYEVKGEFHSKTIESAWWEYGSKEHLDSFFLSFFLTWQPTSLRDEDWQKVRKEEQEFPSLAERCIESCYKLIEESASNETIDRLLEYYIKALDLFPQEVQFWRKKGLLLSRRGEKEQAIQALKKAVLLKPDWYIWAELGDTVTELKLKAALYSKALLLQKQESFVGNVRLGLAAVLIEQARPAEAKRELEQYRKGREENNWKLASAYEELDERIEPTISPTKSNWGLYQQLAEEVNLFIYQEIPTTEMVVVGSYRNKKGRDVVILENKKERISTHYHKREEEEIKPGEVYDVRLNKEPSGRIQVLTITKSAKEKWLGYEVKVGVVEYKNRRNSVLHIRSTTGALYFSKEQYTAYETGDFLSFYLVNEFERANLILNESLAFDVGIEHTHEGIAVVDNVNVKKGVFHLQLESGYGGLIRLSETAYNPTVGNCFVIRYLLKNECDKKEMALTVLTLSPTEEARELVRTLTGDVVLPPNKPYGFLDNIFIPPNLVKEHHLFQGKKVTAKCLIDRGRWRVFEIL